MLSWVVTVVVAPFGGGKSSGSDPMSTLGLASLVVRVYPLCVSFTTSLALSRPGLFADVVGAAWRKLALLLRQPQLVCTLVLFSYKNRH